MCFQLLLDHGETNRLHLKETYKLGELHVYTHTHRDINIHVCAYIFVLYQL